MYLIGGGDYFSKLPPGGSLTLIYDDAGSNRNCRIFDDYIYVNKVWGGEIQGYDIAGMMLEMKKCISRVIIRSALEFDVEGVMYWTTAWQTEVYLYAPRGAEEAVIYEDEIVASDACDI